MGTPGSRPLLLSQPKGETEALGAGGDALVWRRSLGLGGDGLESLGPQAPDLDPLLCSQPGTGALRLWLG